MYPIRVWCSKSNPLNLLLLGVLVGIGGAIGAALFHTLIYYSTLLFYGHTGNGSFLQLIEILPVWQRILIPTLGGLLVGIIFTIAKVSEAEGEGVPEVMEALAHKQGTIRPIVAPIKILTAAITLGSGGSAGREGPVIQIGSAIGSSVAQFFKQNPAERSLLLAAGAAAGIGGTFGAPIAGVLFTVEILRHRSRGFLNAAVIVLAAGIGTVGSYLLTGHSGLRYVVSFEPTLSTSHIIAIFLLGLIASLVAISFGTILSLSRTLFKKIRLPQYSKPAIGGFLIGCIGIFFPAIHEPAAYSFMTELLESTTLPLGFLLVLLVVKMIATGTTLGSGGSGGIFAPLLFMGAITGSVFGSTLVLYGYITPAQLPLFVLGGMAAVFSAAAHAPLTAAFIAYEMTTDIRLLLPLILLCITASFIAKKITPQSIYHFHTD